MKGLGIQIGDTEFIEIMKNEEFYKPVQVPKRDRHIPVIFSSYWPIFIIGNLLAISMGSVVAGRYNGAILSDQDYYRVWRASALIVLVLNIILSWFMDIRPYLDKRKGIFWRGSFTIAKKELKFGRKYLIIKPGIGHIIRVRSELYYSVQIGDRILLERSYLGDIIKIERISGLKERIRNKKMLHKIYEKVPDRSPRSSL